MPRLVTKEELLSKVAALRSADQLGRDAGARLANEELAKLAGKALAGSLTHEEWELLKTAGLFSRAGNWLSGGGMGRLFNWGKAGAKAATPAISYSRSYLSAHPEIASTLGKTVQKVAPAAAQGGFMKGLSSVGRSAATFGKVLPWAVGGGIAYGLMKGVPWAARQLEHSSSQSMAPSMGWSPVDYGYGSTPYGPGMANMGRGA